MSFTGTVGGQWTNQDVGIAGNALAPMYVTLNGSATVYHDDPAAAQIEEWTQWPIDLQKFADQGVVLSNVNTISIGFGDKTAPQAGGSGLVFFDDIRLYRPGRPVEISGEQDTRYYEIDITRYQVSCCAGG